MEIFMGCDAMRWNCHQTLRPSLYDHQEGEKVPIPTQCPEDTHPLKVFEETRGEKMCVDGSCLYCG